MSVSDLVVTGVLAETGFTVALFVVGEAFSDPVIQGAAKMGAMMSLFAIAIGYVSSKFLRK